jgi:hypothetical protein
MGLEIRMLKRSAAMAVALMFVSTSAMAISDYTETFATGAAGWTDNTRTGAGWDSTGGPDGSPAATVSFNYGTFVPPFPGSGPVLFRGEGVGASAGAFMGDWTNADTLSIQVKHDSPIPLAFFARLATPAGYPGGIFPYFGAPVVGGVWTTLSWNPNAPGACIMEGPGTCDSFLGGVGYLQFGTDAPSGAGGTYNFAFDDVQVTAVPEPSTAMLCVLGLSGLSMWTRRNRKAL